jgi:rhamnopyranosyl-N-acetylglucosaminyl-diphospho-decaprenol beta-1,3/1,4-galactofuranosyltransferase
VSFSGASRVWAVVVTFERPRVLDLGLEALTGQSRPPERILVVDNGSGAPTRNLLTRWSHRSDRLSVLRLDDNLGPAGGFAEGIRTAVEGGADRVWLLDDDARADPRCLEYLLAFSTKEGAHLVFPAVFDTAGKPADFPGWSGVLISADAVREAGLPNRDLFWWIEDTEYLQWRLPRVHGITSHRCPEARVEHGGGPRRSPRPGWMLYYEVRNTLWYRFHVQDTSWRRRGSRAFYVVSATLLRTLLAEDRKLHKLGLIVRGAVDGLRGRLGRTVVPPAPPAPGSRV